MVDRARVDNIERDEWEARAREFADYSIYQTWAYQVERARLTKQNLSRVIVFDETGKACLMCQVRQKRLPVIGVTIGYIQWGPLVRRFDSAGSYDGQAITVLRDALFENGIHVVRLVPNIVDNDAGQKVVGALTSAGFVPIEGKHRYRTFLVNVSDSEDAIRSRLRKSFRRDLRYAEKAGFEVKAGPDDELFNILVELYEESKRRKGFKGLEMAEFHLPQGQLSREEKMKVFVAFHEGKAASALLSSELGDVSITLLAASNEAGLKGGSSYLLWYQACISSCRKGLKWCDLGGIDRQANPTVYEFKSRLGGQEVSHIGAFECYRDTRSRLVMKMVNRVI